MKKEDVKNFHPDHLLAVYPHKKASCHFTEKYQKHSGWCWLGLHADSERR